VSKERAKRRAEREEAGASTREQAESALAGHADAQKRAGGPPARSKRAAQRSWWDRVVHPHGRRRFSRQTRTQRATVIFAMVAVVALVWIVADDWGLRIALTLAALLATPAVVTMALGRSHR